MSLIQALIVVVVVGIVLGLVNAYLPMDARLKQLINTLAIVLVVLFICVWLLRFAGLA